MRGGKGTRKEKLRVLMASKRKEHYDAMYAWQKRRRHTNNAVNGMATKERVDCYQYITSLPLYPLSRLHATIAQVEMYVREAAKTRKSPR